MVQAYYKAQEEAMQEFNEKALPPVIASLRKNLEELVEYARTGKNLWKGGFLGLDNIFLDPSSNPQSYYILSKNGELTITEYTGRKRFLYHYTKTSKIEPKDIPFEDFDSHSLLHAASKIEGIYQDVFAWKKS